MGRTNVQVL